MKCKERESFLGPSTIPETPASILSQFTSVERSGPQCAPCGSDDSAKPRLTTSPEPGTHNSSRKKTAPRKVKPNDEPPTSPTTPAEPELPNNIVCGSASGAESDHSLPLEIQTLREGIVQGSGVTNQSEDEHPGLDGGNNVSMKDAAIFGPERTISQSAHSYLINTRERSKNMKGQYTRKQLAGMALLAANEPCSAVQVQQWVSDNFSNDCGDPTGRGRSLQACLAGKSEFRAIKGVGRRRLYDFADDASRRQFEVVFRDHPAVKAGMQRAVGTHVEETMDGAHEADVSVHEGRFLSMARTEPEQALQPKETVGTSQAGSDMRSPPDTEKVTARSADRTSSIFSPNPLSASDEAVSHDFDGVFMPFERADLFQRTGQLELPPNVRQYWSFHDAFPDLARSSVYMMSTSEIEEKIQKIKKRPSRKAAWGTRLAFARLHRLDVHDEKADAWKPRAPLEPRDPQNTGNKHQLEEQQSLRDMFDLPQNPIPILYNEQLAFRGGTLVC
jgi:hypothetical protein